MPQSFQLARTTWLSFVINKYKAGLPAEIKQVPIYISQSLVMGQYASPKLLCDILPCEQGLTYQKSNRTPVEDLYSQIALQSYPTVYGRRSQSSIRAVNINQKISHCPKKSLSRTNNYIENKPYAADNQRRNIGVTLYGYRNTSEELVENS